MVPVLAMISAQTDSLDSMVGAQGVVMPPYASIASTLHCMCAELIRNACTSCSTHLASDRPKGSASYNHLFQMLATRKPWAQPMLGLCFLYRSCVAK